MEKEIKCSFCGTAEEDLIMLKGLEEDTFICEKCLEQGMEVINEQKEYYKTNDDLNLELEKPSDIHKKLDDYVIGQEKAKKILSVAVYNHYKTILYKQQKRPKVELQKSNILLLGPTGVGKTYLVQTLAKILDVPLAIQDATSLTEAGYVGEDVENCVRKLIEAADGDIEKAERGIIYIDEIDKISRKGDNVSITRDVSGEGVQQALLKIIEGDNIEVPMKGGRKNPMEKGYKIDTSNILFICGGAFEGIEKIVEKRLNKKSSIGFDSIKNTKNKKDLNELYQQIKTEDIKRFGLLPELLGRLPIVCSLNELDETALIDILTKPKNALVKQYQELFKMDNVELKFEENALDKIAKLAIKNKTGARSLRSIMEATLLEHMYSLPETDCKEFIVSENMVQSERNNDKIVGA